MVPGEEKMVPIVDEVVLVVNEEMVPDQEKIVLVVDEVVLVEGLRRVKRSLSLSRSPSVFPSVSPSRQLGLISLRPPSRSWPSSLSRSSSRRLFLLKSRSPAPLWPPFLSPSP